jgi:hypothetical protein
MENGMKKNVMKLGLVSLLCFGIGVCLIYSVAWGQAVSHFSVSPIGDPAENVPGQVQVGLETNTIEIAARDDQGTLVGDFSGKVFLSQVTDYGLGRTFPQAVHLQNGKWTGKVQVFRSGEKRAAWGVTGDVKLVATERPPSEDNMEIIITGDNEYYLWVNGIFVGNDDKWLAAETYVVPVRPGKNVLAIFGKNYCCGWTPNGLVVEVRVAGQVVFRSNSLWVVNSRERPGWTGLDYNDSGWSSVEDLGTYASGSNVDGFPENSVAHWIWGTSDHSYFRGSFEIEGSIPPPSGTFVEGESNRFCVLPENLTQLLTVLPGESYSPGSLVGRRGLPTDQNGKQMFTVDVYATDQYWNRISGINHIVTLSSTDSLAALPSYAIMNDGKASMEVMLNTNGSFTITSHDDSDNRIKSHTSSPFTVIAEKIDHFVFDSIVSPIQAAEPFAVIITAADSEGNLVDDFNGVLDLAASTGTQTYSPSEIQMVSGWWSGEVTITKADALATLSIRDGFEEPHTGSSNRFDIEAGAAKRLQILLPGETATPGVSPGKFGSVGETSAGDTILVRVNVVDEWWNVVGSSSDVIRLTSSDPAAVLPPDSSLDEGSGLFEIILNTTGLHGFMVSDQSSSWIEPDSSAQIRVNSSIMDRFVFEEITGPITAGESFHVDIRAVDAQGNAIEAHAGTVTLQASTGVGTLSPSSIEIINGNWSGEVTITTASDSLLLTAADGAEPPHAGLSNRFQMIPGSLTALQVLLPGEAATPGIAPGKTGSPSVQSAGETVTISIRAVDEYWNRIDDLTTPLALSATDSFAVLPETASVAGAIAEIPVTFRTASSHRVFAKLTSQTNIPEIMSKYVAILPGNFSQLLLLMPGENIIPGDDETDPSMKPGRRGTPAVQTVGLPFMVHVVATDDYWNPVSGAPADRVSLFTTDNSAIINPSESILVNGIASFLVTFLQGGNQVIRAIDSSNAAISSSPDVVADILRGGLHYEIELDTNRIVAGEEFEMQVSYRNGVGDILAHADQMVTVSAVSANDLVELLGTPMTPNFTLQIGEHTVSQSFNKASLIRFKIEDEIGTEPAYSEPVTVLPAAVNSIQVSVENTEIRALEETEMTALLEDAFGNRVPGQEIHFNVISGTGRIEQSPVISDSEGAAIADFMAGMVTETNHIRVTMGSVLTDTEIIVNLTPSTFADGVVINFPNPFGADSPSTTIDYYLSEDADVSLDIYDLFGHLVWTREFEAGAPGGMGRGSSSHPNSVEWSGVNDKGQKVGNGGYILIARAVAHGKVVMNSNRKIAVLR